MEKRILPILVLFFCGPALAVLPRSSTGRGAPPKTVAKTQGEHTGPKVYTGTVVAIGRGAGLGTATFTLRITEHTSDEDAQRNLTTLAEKGQEALLEAIKDKHLGSFAIGGRIGRRINVVRAKEIEGKLRLRIVFERWLRMAELRGGYRSLDYPFGYIELFIDRNGKGEGTYIGAAKIKWERDEKTGEHQVEIENFATYPDKLMGVTLRE
jgi:hypothetical protein